MPKQRRVNIILVAIHYIDKTIINSTQVFCRKHYLNNNVTYCPVNQTLSSKNPSMEIKMESKTGF